MNRRGRVFRNSYQSNSRQSSSRRSNQSCDHYENVDIQNQNNGSERPNYDHRNASSNFGIRCAQTPKNQTPVPRQIPLATALNLDLNCISESSESEADDRSQFSSIGMLNHHTYPPLTEDNEICSEQYTLLSLPDDVLFFIFTYLQPKDLCRIICVCRQLQYLASKDAVWLHHAKVTAVVKHFSSCQPCSPKELCRVAPNWKLGQFKEGFAVKHKQKFMPWIQRNNDELWFSMGNNIRCLQLCSSGQLREDKDRCLHGLREDATRFMVKKDRVVSGCRDGSVCCWDVMGTPLFTYQQVHRSDTHCVDFTDTVVISGSRDTTCKILPMEAHADNDDLVLQNFDAGERVWSLKISPCESFFAAGLAGCLDDPPVIMWDIESGECLGQLSMNHRRGAGVLDLRFESAHELLTCDYNAFIRLWDLRTQTCVRQWEEPHDSALYCLETDGSNAILVGTALHGMVRLWDKRQTEPVQVYYSASRKSPVYSVAMDYGHIYLALDVGLNVMDFTWRNSDTLTAGCSTFHQGMTRREHRYHRRTFKR